jgi:hypothetical protein
MYPYLETDVLTISPVDPFERWHRELTDAEAEELAQPASWLNSLKTWKSLLPAGPLYKIPKGLYGVYILSSPAGSRSAKTRAMSRCAPVDGMLEFYVGFGKNERPLTSAGTLQNNHHKTAVIKKGGIRISLVYLSHDETKALWVERLLEVLIGRRELGTGPLTNKRDCGGPASKPGPEARTKMSRSQKEWNKTKEGQAHLRKLYDLAHTPEARAKGAETQRQYAKTKEGQAHYRKLCEVSHTPEIIAKRAETQRQYAKTKEGQAALRKLVEAAHTPEATAKALGGHPKPAIEGHFKTGQR